MSASFVDWEVDTERSSADAAGSVRRVAGYLQGSGDPFFAWLHQPDRCRVGQGVIICPPIGYEQLHSHRGLRHLADAFASRRLLTLRFDWHGTGDSPGSDDDPDRVATWLSNLRDAIAWMRHEQGCEQIALVGLRLGATLASVVAAEQPIDQLLLWSPVIKGRAHVREQKLLGLTAETPTSSSAVTNDIEAAGFFLNAETADDLGQIDLLKLQPKFRRGLVVSRAELPPEQKLIDHLSQSGATVDSVMAPGYAEMMTEPHRGEVPQAAIQEMTEWLATAMDADSIQSFRDSSVSDHSAGDILGTAVTPTALVTPEVRESTFQICDEPDLFGIVSEPVAGTQAHLPLIVILNAGTSYRIGPGRMNVEMARSLAVQGFRCLRLDLNGLGDSVTPHLRDENDSYSATAFRDIDHTLRAVEQRLGVKRIVLMGLCSGAYAAFQSAAQLTNPSLVEAVLINPLTYFWKEGMSLDASPTKHLLSFHYYRRMMTDPRKWLKLLSGRSKIGFVGACKVLAKRLSPRPASSSLRGPGQSGSSAIRQISHPVKEDLAADLQRVVNFNRTLAMFFSANDPGFDILNFHARRKANQLRKAEHLKIGFVDDADHTFSIRRARVELIRRLNDHLLQRFRKQ